MCFLCAAKVTSILSYEKAGIPHFRLSLAPGADARIHARISRSFFCASLGAASMYSLMLAGRFFWGVMISFYRLPTDTPIAFARSLTAVGAQTASANPNLGWSSQTDHKYPAI